MENTLRMMDRVRRMDFEYERQKEFLLRDYDSQLMQQRQFSQVMCSTRRLKPRLLKSNYLSEKCPKQPMKPI